jgi:hypothetical protein
VRHVKTLLPPIGATPPAARAAPGDGVQALGTRAVRQPMEMNSPGFIGILGKARTHFGSPRRRAGKRILEHVGAEAKNLPRRIPKSLPEQNPATGPSTFRDGRRKFR